VKACVVDASVAVKWILDSNDEQLVDHAKALLDRHERGEAQFIVPELGFCPGSFDWSIAPPIFLDWHV